MSIIKGLHAKMIAADVKAVMEKKGYAFFEGGIFNVNIVGIRSKERRSNKFDDVNIFKVFLDLLNVAYVSTSKSVDALIGIAAYCDVRPQHLSTNTLPLLRQLVNQFVHDRARPEVVAVGINTVREICLRCPLVMHEDLLQDLAQYKRARDKPVATAARARRRTRATSGCWSPSRTAPRKSSPCRTTWGWRETTFHSLGSDSTCRACETSRASPSRINPEAARG